MQSADRPAKNQMKQQIFEIWLAGVLSSTPTSRGATKVAATQIPHLGGTLQQPWSPTRCLVRVPASFSHRSNVLTTPAARPHAAVSILSAGTRNVFEHVISELVRMSDGQQVLQTAKAALDSGLITNADYDSVKDAFLRAQQIKAGLDAGFIVESDYNEVKHAFLKSLQLHTAPAAAGALGISPRFEAWMFSSISY